MKVRNIILTNVILGFILLPADVISMDDEDSQHTVIHMPMTTTKPVVKLQSSKIESYFMPCTICLRASYRVFEDFYCRGITTQNSEQRIKGLKKRIIACKQKLNQYIADGERSFDGYRKRPEEAFATLENLLTVYSDFQIQMVKSESELLQVFEKAHENLRLLHSQELSELRN